VFPLDDSTEGWIRVAADLETMINYLIEQKAEQVVVKYIDRRDIEGQIEYEWDYGLAVEAFRDFIGLKGNEVLESPMAFGPKVPMQIVSNDNLGDGEQKRDT
jgi:hypothetical protein